MVTRILLLAAASLLSACATSDSRPPTQNNEPEQPRSITEAEAAHLETMVEEFVTSQKYPNLAIGVVMGKELVWGAGFGKGPAAGAPPDADTFFRAGSVTKLVTATALLALVEDGTLSLDDEAATWLPEVEAELSPAGMPPITLRHLISHSSGIPTSGNGKVDWARHDANNTEADVLAAVDGVTLRFAPGSSHEYSNLAVALAGLVVSRASDQTYRSFVQDRILDPLGMADSVWDVPTQGLAPGHKPSPQGGGYERETKTWRLGAMEPAGGLFTTVRDLARFASFGLGHGSILSAATLAESQTELNDLPGPSGYGLGWVVTEIPGIGAMPWHNGSTQDYGAFLAVLPEHDFGVVILMGSGLRGDVAEIQSLGLAVLAYLVDPETDILPQESTTPQVVIQTVGDRLLALTTAPTAALVEEALVPGFDLLGFFEEVARDYGGCSSHETLQDRGAGSFLLRLDCESDLTAEVVAEMSAPYRIEGFGLRPAR